MFENHKQSRYFDVIGEESAKRSSLSLENGDEASLTEKGKWKIGGGFEKFELNFGRWTGKLWKNYLTHEGIDYPRRKSNFKFG